MGSMAISSTMATSTGNPSGSSTMAITATPAAEGRDAAAKPANMEPKNVSVRQTPPMTR